MKLFICALIAVGVTGCGHSDSRDPSSVRRSRLPDNEYNQVLQTSDEGLAEKAAVGQLGVCSALNLGRDVKGGCNGGDTWEIYLQDPGVYFPSMNKTAQSTDMTCRQWPFGSIGKLLRRALEDGFCFYNSTGPVK